MKTLISIGSIAISSIALNLMPVQQAQAATITQSGGNFTPSATTAPTASISWGDFNRIDSTTVTGWTSQGYNFLYPNGTALTGGALPLYGSTFSAPTEAGNYYIGADSAYQTGYIFETLSNLTIGEMYQVSFYQAAAQQLNFGNGTATTDMWIANVGGTYTAPTYAYGAGGGDNVTVDGTTTGLPTGGFTGGTTYTAPTMTLASGAAAGDQTSDSGSAKVSGWQQDSFVFTATSANTTTDATTGAVSSKLSFLAKGTPTGRPPFALLAGVNAKQIPEPAEYVGTLIGFGFVGLAIKSRLAKKKLDE
jgi:hypothetical protein